MPQYDDFDLIFRIKIMKIDQTLINIAQLFFGWLVASIPFIYQKYFRTRNYVWMFFAAQAVYIFANLVCIFAGTRYNLYWGISDVLLFIFSGNLAIVFEKGFSHFGFVLIFAKLVPVGIESTISSIMNAIVHYNLFVLRSTMGVYINRAWFHVTRANILEGYVTLKIVSLIGTLTPLFYMWCLIPTNKEADEIYKENCRNKPKKDQKSDK